MTTSTCERSQLIQALDLWKEITGIDPSAKSMRLSDWHLRETFDELQEAIDLDPTEVTAILLLAYFINTYLAEREVSLLDLLNERESIEARLAKPRELLAILNRPEVVESREGFIGALRAALARYEAAEREDVTKLLGKPDDIAVLRRDALRSIARLRVDQFLDGNSEAADFRPVYNRTVHQWWNINSMLAAATRMPSGVSLNLIRHPDAFQSYFCFTIRNGGNLFVLTDVPEYSHPLQGFMSRRPDRDLNRRATRNWFPYDLLGLEYDVEAKRLYVKESQQRGLVAYQNAALPLQPVAELPAAELVWVSMMFDLIVEKFWRRGFKAPALSYTAEMLKSETALLEVAKTANLPVPAYQPVGLPALTKHDVSADASTEEEIGRKYHEPNRWMEARYGDRVSDNVLNLLGAPEQVFALEHNTGEASSVDPKFNSLTDWQQSDLLAGRKQLEKVDATSFGSREQIAADRKFIARVNFATHINVLAKEEFEARKNEILAWYRKKLEANVPALLAWCGNTEIWVDDGVHPTFSSYEGCVGGVRRVEVDPTGFQSPAHIARQFFRRHDLSTDEKPPYAGFTLGRQQDNGRPICYLKGTKASYWALFYPGNSAELAMLAGCAVADLPDVLQHWNLLRSYTGNSILNRVDPMIWKAKNPWIKLNLSVRIGFSKRGMAQIDKQPVERPAIANLLPKAPK
jgi:hypothetical protein